MPRSIPRLMEPESAGAEGPWSGPGRRPTAPETGDQREALQHHGQSRRPRTLWLLVFLGRKTRPISLRSLPAVMFSSSGRDKTLWEPGRTC